MDIWQSGSLAKETSDGWLGRALTRRRINDKTQRSLGAGQEISSAFHIASNNQETPLALAGAPVKAPSLARLEDFEPRTSASSGADRKSQQAVIEGGIRASGTSAGGNLLDFVQRTAVSTLATSQRLKEIAKNYEPK